MGFVTEMPFSGVQITVKLNVQLQQLIITLHAACDIPFRPNGTPRNPYVKLYLLPDRRYDITEPLGTLT